MRNLVADDLIVAGRVFLTQGRVLPQTFLPGEELHAVPQIACEAVDDVLGFERGDAPIDDPVERRLEAVGEEGRAAVAGVEIRGRGDGPAEEGSSLAEEAVLADRLEVFGRRKDLRLGHLGSAQD